MEINEILHCHARVKDRCENTATQSPLRKDKVHPGHSTSSLYGKRRRWEFKVILAYNVTLSKKTKTKAKVNK